MTDYADIFLRYTHLGSPVYPPTLTAPVHQVAQSLPCKNYRLRGDNGFWYDREAAINGGLITVQTIRFTFELVDLIIADEAAVVQYLFTHMQAITPQAYFVPYNGASWVTAYIENVLADRNEKTGSRSVRFDMKFQLPPTP